ncbi:hypothetical protein [Leptolyngbya sp. NK1-12]|nr:hypothetical protein [Leptolyngbya sp. NK1-12]
MAIRTKKWTFAEYLTYDDGTGARYELLVSLTFSELNLTATQGLAAER